MRCRICGCESSRIIAHKLRNGEPGIVYYCNACEYAMLEKKYEDIERYYDKEYRKKFKDNLNIEEPNPEEIYKTRCDFQSDRIEIISKYFDKEKNFLEIGCSAGQFISKIKNDFKEVIGVELAKSCAEYVEKEFGIKVYTQTFEKQIWEKKLDNIGFFQVLEHIENPETFLKSVYDNLNEGGRIFVEIPNLNDALRSLYELSGYEGFFYHEAHLSYFTEKSVSKLLKKIGFKSKRLI